MLFALRLGVPGLLVRLAIAFVSRVVRLQERMLTVYSGLVATLGVVFGVSAAGKVRAPWRAFAESLRPLGLVPDRLVPAVAVVVAVVELAIAGGLGWTLAESLRLVPAVPVVALASLLAAAALLCVFTVGIALAVWRGTTARCACFGAVERVLSHRHLVRNGLLLLVAGAALTGRESGEPAAALLGAAAGTVVALILIRLDDLVELFTPFASDPRS